MLQLMKEEIAVNQENKNDCIILSQLENQSFVSNLSGNKAENLFL